MNFPHLSDTRFPDLQNVNVYQFQNTFDYTRWNERTKVKLCNVLWNSDYSDVVSFDNDEKRDSWFDSINDFWTVELRTSARIVPEGYIKLPVPYDVAARYNYLFVDMPIATSADNPLDYENSEGLRRWYFFVHDIHYLSPNATQLYLIPDVWTNFQNKIDITYMMLERGHAPVAASSTEEFLKNPIANNRYLLAPDVNFDNAGITRSSAYVPFGNGDKFVCIASTCPPEMLSQLGTVTNSTDYAPTSNITYSDVDARYGHQLQVNGFGIGNGRDYSNARTPTITGASDGNIANNLTVYGIKSYQVYGDGAHFFQDLIKECPQFLSTVKACFVVDEKCIDMSEEIYYIASHAFRLCKGKAQTLFTKNLVKSDFDYPKELQRFAKLYTSPYAQLEISDNNGNTYTVNIEETSTLNVNSVVSVAFPYINERVYVDGIGGVGSMKYSWVDLKWHVSELEMSNSDWFKYCFDWKIPTFSLFMDGETAYMLENFNRGVKQARQQALVNYHNTMRSANTAYENAKDQADTARINTMENAEVARDNSYRSADTGNANAYNIAAMQKTNADNSAGTAQTNALNLNARNNTNTKLSNQTAETNAHNSAEAVYNNISDSNDNAAANLVIANTYKRLIEEKAISAADDIVGYNNLLVSNNASVSNDVCIATTDVNKESSTATTIQSGIATIATGAISGAASGAVVGAAGGPYGAGVGALIGVAGGAITATTAQINCGTTNNTAQTITDAQIAANSSLSMETQTTNTNVQNAQSLAKRYTYQQLAEEATLQLTNTNAMVLENAKRTRNVDYANALRTQNTGDTNADLLQGTLDTNANNEYSTAVTNSTNLKNTTEQNADRTQSTSRQNARDVYNVTSGTSQRTKDTIYANSGYTRQVAELNAKEILENGKYTAMASILDARNAPPVECCAYSGDPTQDYMQNRGVQMKVKTQSDSAIRQTGDIFARFGYTLNQVWDVQESGLNLMKHFTYWKAAEIWVNDRSESNNMINTFMRKIFMDGVTVWSNPTEIGGVNVYDN